MPNLHTTGMYCTHCIAFVSHTEMGFNTRRRP